MTPLPPLPEPDPLDELVLVERRRLKQATDIGYQAGHAAARAEAEALLREARKALHNFIRYGGHYSADKLTERIDAFLAGGDK